MNYQTVDSSTIEAIAYDEASSTLRVRFKNRTEYEYAGVAESIYRGLLEAPSVGKFFDVNVKKAGFRYRQLR